MQPTGPGCCAKCGSKCWNVTTKRIDVRGIDVDVESLTANPNPIEMLILAAAEETWGRLSWRDRTEAETRGMHAASFIVTHQRRGTTW